MGVYACGPILRAAAAKDVPTLIQEQNSYAGVTNRMLAKQASTICVAYEGKEKFFPKEKIVLTGNPCRQDLVSAEENNEKGHAFCGLDSQKKTILMVGGSLGARTLNESIIKSLPLLAEKSDVQVIWQCGKYYYTEMLQLRAEG